MNSANIKALCAGKDDDTILLLAQTAEQAERYEDMCIFMTELAKNTQTVKRCMTVEERNLLSVAFKNVIGAKRSSWRVLSSMEDETTPQTEKYKVQIQDELIECSQMVLGLLKDYLIPAAMANTENNGEEKVFYMKMSGDYNRYLAEAVDEDTYKTVAQEDYSKAYEIAKVELEATHPVRLGLALNYSVCKYEIMKENEAACDMAKEAFDQAISELDTLAEADYKDSTLIMQLLRDNLTLWTSNTEDDPEIKIENFDD